MGALSFTEFKDLLKFRAGNNASLEAASPGDTAYNLYGIWINSAYRQLCTQENILGLKKTLYFPELFTTLTRTTTDGTAYVSSPVDVLYVEDVYDTTNNVNLDWIPWAKYIDYTDRTDTTAEGDPTEWVRRGGNIYLHRTPGTTGNTLTIHYKKRVPDITGTGVTLVGAEWDDVIIELAANKMFTWLHEYDKAKFCKEAFLEMAAGLSDVYYQERKDSKESWGPSHSYMSGQR